MARRRRSRKRRRADRKRELIVRIALFGIAVLLVLSGVFIVKKIKGQSGAKKVTKLDEDAKGEIDWTGAPDIDVRLLTQNEYSRPGNKLTKVNSIVIHYTANPGSSAVNNRDYFEGLKNSHETKASSHFIVGLDGEVVQCIPTSEISYASNDRNSDTISIECCHPDESGKFNQQTYEASIQLTAWLCKRFGLTTNDIIRHYDVTGKLCPKYFVENEDAWSQFKADVEKAMDAL